jgi:hypothetical protein
MINRHERRKANKGKPKLRQQGVVKSEVYSLTGKNGEPLHLDVVSMRAWAEQHAERVSIPIDLEYINRLIARNAITQERVKAVIANPDGPKPLLLCRDINSDGDEIVDGNHTYAALGMALVTAQRQGSLPPGFVPKANAYELLPEHWQRFVIPLSMFAKKPT